MSDDLVWEDASTAGYTAESTTVNGHLVHELHGPDVDIVFALDCVEQFRICFTAFWRPAQQEEEQ